MRQSAVAIACDSVQLCVTVCDRLRELEVTACVTEPDVTAAPLQDIWVPFFGNGTFLGNGSVDATQWTPVRRLTWG